MVTKGRTDRGVRDGAPEPRPDAPTAAPDGRRPLETFLGESRRLTGAEAGTVYVREGDFLRFAEVQNSALERRLGEAECRRRLTETPLRLLEPSIASYVALTRGVVNVPDAYDIPIDRPYRLDRRLDAKLGYRTRSMLALPLRDGRGAVFGVLQLINALDDLGDVIPFTEDQATLVTTLLASAAGSLRPRATGLAAA